MPSGTNTIFFIPKSAVPKDRKVTYGRLVASLRPTKSEVHRVRVTVGGDRLDYPDNTTTHCASMTTTKCLLNSTISTPDARFMCMDLKDFYYGTPMARYEYMRLKLDIIPEEIIAQYNLRELASPDAGWVYMEIRKGMPGLKQAGRIANDRLTKHLAAYGYAPVPRTRSLWKHHTRDIVFALVVDDFGVKYTNPDDAKHLLHALQAMYTVTEDWTGTLFLGITLEWDYVKGTVELSMPGYIPAALARFQHPMPKYPTHSPHFFRAPVYGAKVQYADNPPDSPLLNAKERTHIQQIIGVALYWSQCIDTPLNATMSTLGSEQAKATQDTQRQITRLLDFMATHPNPKIRYRKSDMILWIHSDGSYLSYRNARSRVGGFYFLSDHPGDMSKLPIKIPAPNGPIHSIARILKNIMASAAEVEIAATFMNGQEAVPIRVTLVELGHPQPPTPMMVDNTTAVGFANDTIKQKRSKAIDMRFYWVKDRVLQKQLAIYWAPGPKNRGDVHTKYHPAKHFREERKHHVHES
jgi:hypothetical protein